MKTKRKRPTPQLILLECNNERDKSLKRKFLIADVRYSSRPDMLIFNIHHYKKTLEKWGFEQESLFVITYEYESYLIDDWTQLYKSTLLYTYRISARGKSVVDLYLRNHK